MKILALVLAGGEGTRLYPLTAEHAKPALRFAGECRLIDFVLSNLANSGISAIYVLAQHRPQSLIRHIDTAWLPAFQPPAKFLTVLLPPAHEPGSCYRGTADAVYKNLALIRQHQPDLVAVFAADHVYRMDVRQMVSFHLEREAEVSVAAVPVPIEEASSFGVVAAGPEGDIEAFQEKPRHPAPMPLDPDRAYASMGNYLFDANALEELLEEASARGGVDFGRHILPGLPKRRRVFAYDFSRNRIPGLRPHEEPAYWRDVGTHRAFAAAQQDVKGPRPRFDLSNRRWPIRGAGALEPSGSPLADISFPPRARASRIGCAREPNLEARPAIGGKRLDRSVVRFHNGLGDGEPQPGAVA